MSTLGLSESSAKLLVKSLRALTWNWAEHTGAENLKRGLNVLPDDVRANLKLGSSKNYHIQGFYGSDYSVEGHYGYYRPLEYGLCSYLFAVIFGLTCKERCQGPVLTNAAFEDIRAVVCEIQKRVFDNEVENWPHFSGNLDYPVPIPETQRHIAGFTPHYIYVIGNNLRWLTPMGHSIEPEYYLEYGKKRYELAAFIADRLELNYINR